MGGERQSTGALRDKQRVILLCAPVTLLFTFADTVALQRFSWPVFGVRLTWTVLIAASALVLPRVSERGERWLMTALAVSSSAFFGVLTWMTGGFGSPLFHWILAMPLVIAVVLQEHPSATAAAAVTTIASGLLLAVLGKQSAAICVEWAVQAIGMSALAVYASASYRRLRRREQALREAGLLADERARSSDAAVHARDEFLSIASHELKTPLTVLTLQVQRLLRRPERAGDPVLGAIEHQVDRLSELVETLLDVSRITVGRLSLEPTEGDIAATIRQVASRYTPMAERQGCQLVVDADHSLPGVFDPARFEQVLSNLLSNAIKFGPGQPIEIGAQPAGGLVRITVRDHGLGIPAADQRRIFERFERGSSDHNYGGLGLGLWISRRIVEQMGGRIELTSRPGQGATFTIELPLEAQARGAATG
jgi:signal transduction histidine kinase